MGWEPFDADLSHLREMGATEVRSLRNGAMRVIVCREPRNPARLQWHMSISRPDRYPSWDEIRDARYELMPRDITVAMILPPPKDYVNLHNNCFHLWEIDE
jgi:hypothetical protein